MPGLLLPSDLTTWADRLAYCYAAREKLRREYNAQPAITPAYYRGRFRPLSIAISEAIHELRASIPPGLAVAACARLVDGRIPFDASERWPNRLGLAWAASTLEEDARDYGDLKQVVPDEDLAGVVLPDLTAAAAEPPDPTEDFTTYTEADPGAMISKTADTVTYTDLDRAVDAWVYADKGAAHFADFEHTFQAKLTSVNSLFRASPWALSNVVNDTKYWWDNFSQAINLMYDPGTPKFALYNNEPRTSDSYANSMLGVDRWFTCDRDGTTLNVYVYSDAGRETLLDTLTVAIADGRAYRYVFPLCSYNSAFAGYYGSGYIKDLDLQEITTVTGHLAQTLPAITQAAAGRVVVTGDLAQTLPAITQAAAGRVVVPPFYMLLKAGQVRTLGPTAGRLRTLGPQAGRVRIPSHAGAMNP